MEESVERYELDSLLTKPPESQNDKILPDAPYPPSMFSTEWLTPLIKNGDSSESTKIFHNIPIFPIEFGRHPHDLNHSNVNGQKNQPSTSPPPPQVSNHNPSTANDIDVTNITP